LLLGWNEITPRTLDPIVQVGAPSVSDATVGRMKWTLAANRTPVTATEDVRACDDHVSVPKDQRTTGRVVRGPAWH
jgi:hypothetical protein